MISCIVRGDEEDAATVLQRCIDRTALAGGGVIYVPGGTWPIRVWPGVRIRDGVHLRFAPHARIVRDGAASYAFVADGASDFSITGANIDINRTENFQGAIGLERCRDFRIRDCTLGTSAPVPLDDTIHAILMQDCDDWDVHDIRTRQAQVKLAGGAGARRGRCSKIRAVHARNYAVALVLGLGPENRAIEDCVIEDVIVRGHCAGGVYLGNDQRTNTGVFRGVRVRNIDVRGPTSRAGRGVLLRKCAVTEDVEISDVRVHHSYYEPVDPLSFGVIVANTNDGTGTARDIRIRDVRQRGHVMYGMEIHGPISGLQLEDIDLEVARRYIATAGSITGTEYRVRGAREDLVGNGYTVDVRRAA